MKHPEPNGYVWIDWRGREVRSGDLVVYAVTCSSSITMVEAEVVACDVESDWRGDDIPVMWVRRRREACGYGQADTVDPKVVKLTVPQRVVKVS